ncbi:MAG: hypothetical protein L0Z53_02740 [Acidobacteriales bacterium]|nr:hypothetical protein [Terriglobales bacterium]
MPSRERKVLQWLRHMRAALPPRAFKLEENPDALEYLEMELRAIEDGVLDPPRRTYIEGLANIAELLMISEKRLRGLLASNAEFQHWVRITPGTRRRYRMEDELGVVIQLQREAALHHAAGYRRSQPRKSDTGKFE